MGAGIIQVNMIMMINLTIVNVMISIAIDDFGVRDDTAINDDFNDEQV